MSGTGGGTCSGEVSAVGSVEESDMGSAEENDKVSGEENDKESGEENGGDGLMRSVDRDAVLEIGLCGALYHDYPGCCLHCGTCRAPYEVSGGGFGAGGLLSPCHPSSLMASDHSYLSTSSPWICWGSGDGDGNGGACQCHGCGGSAPSCSGNAVGVLVGSWTLMVH